MAQSNPIKMVAKWEAKFTGANVTASWTRQIGNMNNQMMDIIPALDQLKMKIKAACNTLGFLNSEISSALAFGRAMWKKINNHTGDTLLNELAACIDGKWAVMSTLTPADYRDLCLGVFNIPVP